jgi:hypothetical protein
MGLPGVADPRERDARERHSVFSLILRSHRSLKASSYLLPTLREVPAEAELPSHQLLLRGGFIRKLAAGVYSYLPLGWRVARKIEQILRDETDRAGGRRCACRR